MVQFVFISYNTHRNFLLNHRTITCTLCAQVSSSTKKDSVIHACITESFLYYYFLTVLCPSLWTESLLLLKHRQINYCPICLATSSAKFSSFFSRPSPVSKRTNFLTATLAPFALATSATYCATVCFPSSAFT